MFNIGSIFTKLGDFVDLGVHLVLFGLKSVIAFTRNVVVQLSPGQTRVRVDKS